MTDLLSTYTPDDIYRLRRAAIAAKIPPAQFQHDISLYVAAVQHPEIHADHFGVSVTNGSEVDVDLANQLGFRWFRSGSEYGWGDASFARQVKVAQHAESLGMRYLWCTNKNGKDYSKDAEIPGWADFHKKIADAGIGYVEVGNEWQNPDDTFFRPYDPTWARQTRWFAAAAKAIRAANPAVTIITAGHSPYGGDDGGPPKNRWPQTAATKWATLLDPKLYDGVGNHLYSHPGDPRWTFPAHPGWGATNRNRDVWASVKPKPIWNTEFGSNSADFQMDEAKRRDHFGWYMEEINAQRKLGVVFAAHFVHTLRDGDSVLAGESPTMGLVTVKGALKQPTCDWFKTMLASPW